MEEGSHRSFIALFPPQETVEQILFQQTKLKQALQGSHIRWEKEKKFHFTLQFWDDQTDQWLQSIKENIISLCASTPRFHVTISQVGCFPNRYSPKIFWIGSDPESNPELTVLTNAIQRLASAAGCTPDIKPFHPHITIGRGKGKLHSALIQKIETVTFHPIQFECREVRIMKSVLAQSGSTYTTLFTIPLQSQEKYGRR